ncbi:MAG: hypothetical protein ACTSWG_03130 [Candidatus Helarchaeota archaeon]
MDNIFYYLIQDSLTRAIHEYGIEGAEEVIKNVYTCNNELKNAMLQGLKDRINK